MSSENTVIHPKDGMVYACPKCDTAPVRERTNENLIHAPTKKYVCIECTHGFNDLTERTKRKGGGRSAKHGLARKLEEMNPEDLSA